MRELGEFLGWFTVVFFSLSFLNPVVKYVQKTFGKTFLKKETLKKPWQMFMKFIVKNHKLFGLIAALGAVGHFLVQYSRWGFVLSGVVPAVLMLLQGALGYLVSKAKKETKKTLLLVHKIIAVLMVLAIGTHLIQMG